MTCQLQLHGLPRDVKLSILARGNDFSWFPEVRLQKDEFEQLIHHVHNSERFDLVRIETDIDLSEKLTALLKLAEISIKYSIDT